MMGQQFPAHEDDAIKYLPVMHPAMVERMKVQLGIETPPERMRLQPIGFRHYLNGPALFQTLIVLLFFAYNFQSVEIFLIFFSLALVLYIAMIRNRL
jgi:hypothetical protein